MNIRYPIYEGVYRILTFILEVISYMFCKTVQPFGKPFWVVAHL